MTDNSISSIVKGKTIDPMWYRIFTFTLTLTYNMNKIDVLGCTHIINEYW